MKAEENALASKDESPRQKPNLEPRPWTSGLQKCWKINICSIANSVGVCKSNLRKTHRLQNSVAKQIEQTSRKQVQDPHQGRQETAGCTEREKTDPLCKKLITVRHLKTLQTKLCARSNTSTLRHWHINRSVWDNHPSVTTPVGSRRLEFKKEMFYFKLSFKCIIFY